MVITWTKPAIADLKRIYNFIAEDSKFYAAEVSERLMVLADSLKELSYSHRIVY